MKSLIILLLLGIPALAQDGPAPPSNLHTNIYLPNIPVIAATHHEIQDQAFIIRLRHPGYTSSDQKWADKDYVECGPTIAATVFEDMQNYDFKYSPQQEDPEMASVGVFALAGKTGTRGWIRNSVKPFEIWIAINKKDGSHDLGDIREPDFTIGQYLWTLARRDGNPPDSAKKKAIREEIAKRLKIELQPEDIVVLYGFKVKGGDFTLYAEPGLKP